MVSSGSRPVEIIGLRKMDFFWTGRRYGAKIPAHLTKKKQARTIFFSKECNAYLNSLLKKFNDSQTIFTRNPILKNARTSEDKILRENLKKLGMHYSFDTTGFSKINLYCFRAYFFTKAIRAFNEDVAHSMIGHGAYLQQYQRRTDREKEELYEELEPHLLINDLEQKNSEIKKLTQLNAELMDKEDRLKIVEKRLHAFESFLESSTQPELIKLLSKMDSTFPQKSNN